MDLNYLLERHQSSLEMAGNAGSERARVAHSNYAAAHAAKIAHSGAPRTELAG